MGTAAEILRSAREQSGLTQAALAQLTGITQSVISEYENGRREPSFAAVDRIVAANGLEIEVTARARIIDRLLPHVITHASDLHNALAPLGAESIRLFGSVARGEDTDSSDVDLLVDVGPAVGMFALLRMQRAAEEILGRPVDIVPRTGLKPGVAAVVEQEAILL